MSASLDSSLDPMEEIRYRKKYSGHWIEIMKDTHFNFDELEQIMVMFFKIQKRDDKPAGGPDVISRSTIRQYTDTFQAHRPVVVTAHTDAHIGTMNSGAAEMIGWEKMAHFRDVLHTGLNMTDQYIMERVMVALDRGTSPYVTMATFAKTWSLFMRGGMMEKINYCFTCYDLMGEGNLRRETMYQLLKKSLVKSSADDDVEEAVKEFVDILLKRMDVDLDGTISFEDFKESVLKTPQLLEILGMCLPERPAVYAFVGTWCPNWGKM